MTFNNLQELVEYLGSFNEFREFKIRNTNRVLYSGIPMEIAERFGVTKENLEILRKENTMNLALGWNYRTSPKNTFSIFNLVD